MRSPGRIASPAAAALGTKGNSKWEPLSTVEPSPVADHDPFSLGDSDDEKDAVEKVVGKAPEPVKEAGDGERLGDTAERKAVGGVKVGEASGGGESDGAKIEGEKRAAS